MMRGWPFGVDPRLFSKVEDPSGSVQLRYLGSAGLVVQAEQHTMVLDPYVTRHGFLRTVFGRLAPNTEAIRRHLPVADDVITVDRPLDPSGRGDRVVARPRAGPARARGCGCSCLRRSTWSSHP